MGLESDDIGQKLPDTIDPESIIDDEVDFDSRVQKIPYVLACHNGIVAEVYETEEWYRSEEMPERCEFNGKVATDEIRQFFVNKRLPKKYCKKGLASPVLYHD